MKKILTLIVAAILIFLLLRVMYWIPSHFIVGLNPFLGPILLVILTILMIPLLIRFIRMINKKKLANQFSADFLFLSASVGWLLDSLFSAVWLGNTTFLVHVHDTYFVLDHINAELIEAIFMLICAAIYYGMRHLFNRSLNLTAGTVHWALTIIPFYLAHQYSEYLQSPVGLPRRYVDYSYSFKQVIFDEQLTNFRLILFISGQLVFLINIIYLSRKKRPTHPFNS